MSEIINTDDLIEIVEDLSMSGKYYKFYEALQHAVKITYSDKRIKSMRETLKYVYPEKVMEIQEYNTLKVLHEYSQLI